MNLNAYNYRIRRYVEVPFAYLHNRWVNPSDRIIITHHECPRGVYRDTDIVMLFALFQLVVDFVEIECSAMYGCWHRGNRFETKWQTFCRRVHRLPVLHWFMRPNRNALRGLFYLKHETHFKDAPSQNKFSKDMLTLYSFWKHERPRRLDPHLEYYAMRNQVDWKSQITEQERTCLSKGDTIEECYSKQDTEMLHLIINQRNSMWT